MAYEEVGQTTVRGQFFDKAIKQITKERFVMKQAVAVATTGAWTNHYYREKMDFLTAGRGIDVSGVPRLAEFPQASPEWEKKTSYLIKYGLEENIAWEDLQTDEIPVKSRTAIKIAEGIAYGVDRMIRDTFVADGSIQTISISAGYEWDNTASAAIIDNLLEAAEKIKNYKYPTDNLIGFVSSKDKRSIMNYLVENGAQFPKVSTDVAMNGSIGNLAGVNLVESHAIEASEALVVVPKRCATYKQNQPLSTITKEDPYKSVTVRAVEVGTLQITDPYAVVRITNTQA